MTTSARTRVLWRKPDVCAACHQEFATAPIFREDVKYCCDDCASGHLCTCRMEADLAGDAVDGLGLPFLVEAVPEEAEEVVGAPR